MTILLLHYIKQFREQINLYNKYIAIFEREQYISYPVDIELNCILRIYQRYYNEVFFLGIGKQEAEAKLRARLADFFGIKDEYIELSHVEQNQVAEAFRLKGFYFMDGLTEMELLTA